MITIADVVNHEGFQELMEILQRQGATPKLVGGLVRRRWTNHDIDIEVSKLGVKVPLHLLCLKFGRRGWYPVSINIRNETSGGR